MNAIEIDNITKRFSYRGQDVWALKDASLSIKKGEIFGLLGPNGAGKTTMLSIIIKLITPDAGHVRILGEDIDKHPKILERINFVSGDTKFHWVLRTEDILNFYSVAYNLPKEERKPRVEKLMDFFGITAVKDRKFAHLSTGERMRLIFAKAMLNKPEVLLLDEPTLGLDPSIAIRVREEVQRVNKTFKTTVLLTSHYMHEVEQLSKRVAFIDKGTIIDEGSVQKVMAKNFDTYDAIIKVKKVLNKKALEKHGFQVKGTTLTKTLQTKDNLSRVLSPLYRHGYHVLDVKTNKPNLEDYFVKLAQRKGGKS